MRHQRFTYGDIILDTVSIRPTDMLSDVGICIGSVPNHTRRFTRIDLDCSDFEHAAQLAQRGYFFADRRIDVRIDTRHTPALNLKERCELRMCDMSEIDKGAIEQIALESFVIDSRFNFIPTSVAPTTKAVLSLYLSSLISQGAQCILCYHKATLVGFMITQVSGNRLDIRLAAVRAVYRPSGAGIDMYAAAVEQSRAHDLTSIHGLISSSNTAVMNIYSAFGGRFIHAQDWFFAREGIDHEW
jgi:hypothetical protein